MAAGSSACFSELMYELWVGDPAQIRVCRVRKQKTDRRDAGHVLKLMMEDRFPRVWVPSPENRDLRQLLWHRHRLVQMRTRVKNQLQAIAMNEGVRRKKGLWSKPGREQLESLLLAPWTQRRRQDLLELLDRLNPQIGELSIAIEQKAGRRPEARLLMTHPAAVNSLGHRRVSIFRSPFDPSESKAAYVPWRKEFSKLQDEVSPAVSLSYNEPSKEVMNWQALEPSAHDCQFGYRCCS